MMVKFDWITPRRIIFGAGRGAELPALAAQYGARVCLLTGAASLANSGRLERLVESLGRGGLQVSPLRVDREPTAELIDNLCAGLHERLPDVVIAVGGGSVMDAGKAVAALLANGGETLDYLEGVGRGKKLEKPAVPVIAVPTTAGTGCEATKNAVIGDDARTFKKSMRSDTMMPVVALVDPELTYDSPLPVAAASGMDALTQLLEAYTSKKAHPLSDALAQQGLDNMRSLARLPHVQNQAPVRESLSHGALLGGICLANVGLGAVHGIVSPLGAMHPVPHGVGCAALLPAVIRANARKAAEESDTGRPLLHKYGFALELLAGGMSGDLLDNAMKLADGLEGLREKLGLFGLGHYGVKTTDFAKIVAGSRGNSMQTNPVELTDEDLHDILAASL